jgi:glycosyltransferase involved in cell wall biosynthesis
MQVTPSSAPGSALRVLQLGPLYINHLRRWAEHAAALGCTVYAAGHVRPGRRAIDLTDVAEHVEEAPEGLLGLGTASHVAWLRDLLLRVQPDVVHAHWLPKWAYLAAVAGDRPLAVTAWGSDVYLAVGADRRRGERALRSADRVLAPSPHMLREVVARGAPAQRTELVDLGVDLERFRPPSPGEQARLRHELGLPDGPVILSFRAGTPIYNLDVVLDAFRILRERVDDVTLVMAHGDAPLCRPVRCALRNLDASDGVRVVGAVAHADMARYLRAATVGVSIPDTDGSPNSVWEALACGLPVVLSDLPQIDERVGRSEAVRLVAPRPDAVAAALSDVVAHPKLRGRMAEAARGWAVANADQRQQIARLGRVYAALERQARDQAAAAA